MHEILIKTRFKPKQEVWVLEGNKLIKTIVDEVKISLTSFGTEETIKVSGITGFISVVGFHDTKAFNNEDDVIKELRERINKK